jgi:autophagy-related protein 13
VTLETKKALQINQTDSVTNRLPLCVEISLQTVEGDKMILEVWSLNINTELCDPTIKATHTIYNRMGLMLKSLISVTRVTPAYKLSRRQTSDSYNIYYRIYVGEPQIHNLGEFLSFLLLLTIFWKNHQNEGQNYPKTIQVRFKENY